MPPGSSRRPAALLLAILLAGLGLRSTIFEVPHREGDERIYGALLEQLRSGRGYTLQGHPILDSDWMVREQYDAPLFYHPPGGVVWVAPFVAILGDRGFDVAELSAFAVFFLATTLLARELLGRWDAPGVVLAAVLAAFTPIVAHVSVHRWLDLPQVAAVTLAGWLLVRASRRGTAIAATAAGIAIGAGCLVKMNALFAAPGMAALAWCASEEISSRRKVRMLATAFGVAALVVLPWWIAEYRVFGTIFPAWAGRPSARLIADNPFVRQVTVGRTSWDYLRLLPQTVFTLVPSLLILACFRPKGRAGRVGAALALWVAVVVAANMALGAIGYSKLLRYVVLISPAAILLAALALQELLAARIAGGRGPRRVIIAILLVAVTLEAAQGIQSAWIYPDRAWIRPLFGEAR